MTILYLYLILMKDFYFSHQENILKLKILLLFLLLM